jgi:endonuclease YncB( thermonuclease family)
MRPILAACALLCVLACPAGAGGLSGHVRVVDGDSLKMGKINIRLEGIDAPEWDQPCYKGEPLRRYRCGLVAKDALLRLIAGQPVDCTPVLQPDGGTTDRYGRTLAVCSVGGTIINAWMVEHGHAVAFRRYSVEYVPQQDRARAARLGIWAGVFVEPGQWRRWKAVDREWPH